ncbi:MAG: activator of HSP90 ATPase [Saprospiraceae bacterium]|nr:activator of HSP90 ATPase [Saprospiraceae bacterium]
MISDNFITVTASLRVSIEIAWNLWTQPEHIIHWNHASEEWTCPNAETDFKVGGRYTFRMEAKDGSVGFDMSGTYLKIDKPRFLSYDMDDGRVIEVSFKEKNGITEITEITEKFEPESIHSRELQQQGWQAILNNFKRYAEHHEG